MMLSNGFMAATVWKMHDAGPTLGYGYVNIKLWEENRCPLRKNLRKRPSVWLSIRK